MRFVFLYSAIIFLSRYVPAYTQQKYFEDPDLEKFVITLPSTLSKSESVPKPKAAIRSPDVEKVQVLMDSVKAYNKRVKFIEGYRILVYSGTDKAEADRIKSRLYTLMPKADIYVVFKQPTYRIKLGDFIDRLEAHRLLHHKVIREFPRAIVIQDIVPIKPVYTY